MKAQLLLLAVLATAYLQLASGFSFRASYGMNYAAKYNQNGGEKILEHLQKHIRKEAPFQMKPIVKPVRGLRVSSGKKQKLSDLESYVIQVGINKTCGSFLWGWYFPSPDKNAPVLIWLQGGPGASSLFGLFAEHGPFFVNQNLTLSMRDYAWTNKYSIIYVDNPVGTGFSSVGIDRPECYAHGQEDVGRDLFTFLKGFFSAFPALKKNDFYVTGESYGGKYVPSIGDHIVNNLKEASQYFTFKGIAIGDGYTDPINQLDTASLLYQIGLVDENQRDEMSKLQATAAQQINNGEWEAFFNSTQRIIGGDLGIPSLFAEYTNFTYYFNFLNDQEPADNYYVDFLNLPSTRAMLHVGNRPFNDGTKVEQNMLLDEGQTALPRLVNILNNGFKVMLYNGQLDLICPPVLTEGFLQKTDWKYASDYKKAQKIAYKVDPADKEIAGYVRSAKNLHYVMVRNAGHILPWDQPRVALDLITRFIEDKLPSA